MAVLDKLRGAWNAFRVNEENRFSSSMSMGPSYSTIPNTVPFRVANDRTTLASIYNRIAVDFAGVQFSHVQMDERGKYISELNTRLNDALTFEPNVDQGPMSFRQEVALSLFDEGTVAIVPVDSYLNAAGTLLDVLTMRTGKIIEYFPEHIRVNVFNEKTGSREDIIVEKRKCAILHNPFYKVMNEANSTMQRLNQKIGLLDSVDQRTSSGKMDLIIKLPYAIKSDALEAKAEGRRDRLEAQLNESKFGIGYVDGTEDIVQLNRPIENQLAAQIDTLTAKLYAELGLTAEIMDGTANEQAITNYYNRTVYPLATAFSEALQRGLVGIARTKKHQKILYTRNKMQFLTLADLGDVTDKLCRNEVVSSNDVRSWIGMPPSDDPKADELINANMPQADATSANAEEGSQNGT